MECIACTQCIDACDSIMDKIDKPRGLIRYTSEYELAGKPTRPFRPRTIVYATLIAAVVVALGTMVLSRGAFDINVGRSVGEPFTVLPDGRVTNRLRFRVRNQQQQATAFTVAAVAPAGVEVKLIGPSPVPLAPAEMTRVEAWIIVPEAAFVEDSVEGTFEIQFEDGKKETVSFTLLGPSKDNTSTTAPTTL